jgi:glycosyltransferase 2 family protein
LTLTRLLRVIVAVGLTAFLLYKASPAEVLRATARADFGWIAAAVALVLLDRTLMALRWMNLVLALATGVHPPLGVVLRIFFVSSFVSNFVPSAAADLYRAYELSRGHAPLAESTASVLMDRILGVLSMVIVGVMALPFAGDPSLQGGLAAGLGVAAAACGAAAIVVFSQRAAAAIEKVVSVLPWQRARRAVIALTDAVRGYRAHHGTLVKVLRISVAVQIIRILQAWCLGQSLGIELPLAQYFAFVPAILLIMQVPFTINGLGTTQYAFEALFVRAGAPAAPTFALSVLFLALGVVGTLPGAILYAMTPSAVERGSPS